MQALDQAIELGKRRFLIELPTGMGKTDLISLQLKRLSADSTEVEEAQLIRCLNAPRYYFNEDNLRRAYRDRDGNLIDFIRAALSTLKIKGREKKLEENFRAWLVSRSFTLRLLPLLRMITIQRLDDTSPN